jgi:hypothetical protein
MTRPECDTPLVINFLTLPSGYPPGIIGRQKKMKQGISEKKMPHKIMNCKHTFNDTKHFFEGLYIDSKPIYYSQTSINFIILHAKIIIQVINGTPRKIVVGTTTFT